MQYDCFFLLQKPLVTIKENFRIYSFKVIETSPDPGKFTLCCFITSIVDNFTAHLHFRCRSAKCRFAIRTKRG